MERKCDTISRKHNEVQTRVWESYLSTLYEECMLKAKVMNYTSIACSTIIIVLNVLVVGATDLNIGSLAVAIFMVIVSVVKALQLKFLYDNVAMECHDAKAALRDQLLKVRELRNQGDHDNGVSNADFDRVRKGVLEAIQATPAYISLDHISVLNRRGRRVSTQDEQAACAGEPLPRRGGAWDAEAQPPPARPQQPEAAHLAQDEGEAAHPALDEGGAGERAAEQGEGEEAQNQKVQLGAMTSSLLVDRFAVAVNIGTEYVYRYRWRMAYANTTLTVIELVLNAAILAFSSITILEGHAEAVSILAAINAIGKGVQMRLSLDVKEQSAVQVYSELRVFHERAKKYKIKHDIGNEYDERLEQEFLTLTEEYDKLIIKYADWLDWRTPGSKPAAGLPPVAQAV